MVFCRQIKQKDQLAVLLILDLTLENVCLSKVANSFYFSHRSRLDLVVLLLDETEYSYFVRNECFYNYLMRDIHRN